MNTNFDITNKVCAITGATGVLGGCITNYLLANNAKVVIIGQSKDTVDTKLKELTKYHNTVLGFACNVLDKLRVQEVCNQVIKK